jgi:hypothetical protein
MIERADHWTPPDSLGYSSLRPVRLTGQGKALIVLTVALVTAGSCSAWVSGRLPAPVGGADPLRDQGIAADAASRVFAAAEKTRASRHLSADTAARSTPHRPNSHEHLIHVGPGRALVRFVPTQPTTVTP